MPTILNTAILDGVIKVGKDDAFTYVQRLARKEGMLAGISTGAALAAVAVKAAEIPQGARIRPSTTLPASPTCR